MPEGKLRRALTARHLAALAFGTIVGVGWVIAVGDWLSNAGWIGALLAFFLGCVAVSAIGVCYAELASMMPTAGGELAYAEAAFGRRVAFLVGWSLAFGYVSVSAFEAVSVGWILAEIFPAISGPAFYDIFGETIHLGSLSLGLAIMAAFALINIRAAIATGRAQEALTILLIVITLALFAFAIARGEPENLKPYFAFEEGNWNSKGFFAVLATTLVWYAGFDTIPQALEERAADVSEKQVGAIIFAALLCAFVFYAIIITGVSIAAPRSSLESSALPAASAFQFAFGSRYVADMVLFVGVLGLLTTWNAVFFAGTRLIFAMSRCGMLPAALANVSQTRNTPGAAILFVALVAGGASFLGRGGLGPIINAAAASFALAFFISCIGLVRLRIRYPDRNRPFRAPGGSLTAIAAAIVSISFAVTVVDPAAATRGIIKPEWILLSAWVVVGGIFWVFRNRNHSDCVESGRLQSAQTGDK